MSNKQKNDNKKQNKRRMTKTRSRILYYTDTWPPIVNTHTQPPAAHGT